MKRKLPVIGEFAGQPGVKRAERQYLSLPDAIDKWVIAGWGPECPFIGKEDRITVFGSCFGHIIKQWLKNNGYCITPNSEEEECLPLVENGFRFVSAALIYQHLRWGWGEGVMAWDRWVNHYSTGVPEDELQKRTGAALSNTKLFILTYGLSEIWRDKDGSRVRFGPIPVHKFKPETEEFHISTVEETKRDISATIDLIHEKCPDATIVITLSPIPIQTTFRMISSITANSASKAILRAAIDEVIREREADKQLWYWPSFEMIYDMPLPDKWQPDGWHPQRKYSDEIVAHFARWFLKE